MWTGHESPGDGEGRGSAREYVATFVLARKELIQSIARSKLTPKAGTVYDSEDVVSSVLRRVDDLARRGKLAPGCESELWALIKVIATNTALGKTRLIARSRHWVSENPEYAAHVSGLLNACETDDEAHLLVYRMAGSLDDRADRQLFLLQVRGAGHRAIAEVMRISEEACRQRWSRVCRQLRERFPGETPS